MNIQPSVTEYKPSSVPDDSLKLEVTFCVQGVISPLIANAYLHALDVEWEQRMRGAKLIRYCDDLVILCRGNPQPWFHRLEDIIGRLGLTLSADKTRIVDAADGFDFLGMHFRLRPLRSNPK